MKNFTHEEENCKRVGKWEHFLQSKSNAFRKDGISVTKIYFFDTKRL